MVLDITIEDSLLQSVHTLASFRRRIEVVSDHPLLGQTLDSLVVPGLHCWLHFVMLGEDMADERFDHFVVFDELVVFRYLLQDELSRHVDLVNVEDETNIHDDQNHIALFEVEIDSSVGSDHSSWRINEVQ